MNVMFEGVMAADLGLDTEKVIQWASVVSVSEVCVCVGHCRV